MKITLNSELENVSKSLGQRVSDLFEKTQSLPHLQDITDDDIAAEIEAYRSDERKSLEARIPENVAQLLNF